MRTLRTGFFGYHSLISPVWRSNVLSVVGQTMHPSCVKEALRSSNGSVCFYIAKDGMMINIENIGVNHSISMNSNQT